MPVRLREMKHRNFTIGMPLSQGENVTLFTRVKTQSALRTPLVLWSEKALLAQDREQQLRLGVYSCT